MKSILLKSIIISIAALSANVYSSGTSLQDDDDDYDYSAFLAIDPVYSGPDKNQPLTRSDVKLKLNDKINSYQKASKNTKLKGEPGAYIIHNRQLQEDMSFTVLSSIKKRFHSNFAFYNDSSLENSFYASPISKEWENYRNEKNGFKKRKALKVLDSAFENQLKLMKKPHSGNYIFSYEYSGTYEFDFEKMSKKISFKRISSFKNNSYFPLDNVLPLHHKTEARVKAYNETIAWNINGSIPVRQSLGGSLIDALSDNYNMTVKFDNVEEAEIFENYVMDKDDVTYLQVQMELTFDDSISSFIFTPIAGEIKSSKNNIAISKLYTIDKTREYLGEHKFIDKELGDVLPLNKITKILKVNKNSIQLFNGGKELYALIVQSNFEKSRARINNGAEDITVKGMLAKYKYLGVLEGDVALWSLDRLSDKNIDKNSKTQIKYAPDYILLYANGNEIHANMLKAQMSPPDDWSYKTENVVNQRYRGDLSSSDATLLKDTPTKKTATPTKHNPVNSQTNEPKENQTKPSAGKAEIKAHTVKKSTEIIEHPKNDKFAISCNLDMKDTGGFFDGQHIVGTQKTDIPREYLTSRIKQIYKSEGFIQTTGADSNTLYYLAPQDSGKNYNYDATFTSDGFSLEFRTYKGVSISTKAAKGYFCEVIAKI
jgi:hypothetical protein